MKSKPFLKWAGGKHKISNKILEILPKRKVFIEPFVGSGAVFMMADYEEYILNDINSDVINLYRVIKSDGVGFIEYAKSYFTRENNTEISYYRLREVFNFSSCHHERSAIFLYLNKHCFNGLCRYNKKGIFNVPFGRYSNPLFPLNEMMAFYKKSERAVFTSNDFRVTINAAPIDSVIYCDPPYFSLSDTSNFTDYAKEGFTFNDQKQLAQCALNACKKGIPVLVSNHDTDFIEEIYSPAIIHRFLVQRNIAASGSNRRKVGEILAEYKPL